MRVLKSCRSVRTGGRIDIRRGGSGCGGSDDDAISLSQHRLFISEFLKN